MALPRQVGVASVAGSIDHDRSARRYVVDFIDRSVIVLEEGDCPRRVSATLFSTGPIIPAAQVQAMAGLLDQTAAAPALTGGWVRVETLQPALATPEALEAMQDRRPGAWDVSALLLPGGGMAQAGYAPLAFPWGAMLTVEMQEP